MARRQAAGGWPPTGRRRATGRFQRRAIGVGRRRAADVAAVRPPAGRPNFAIWETIELIYGPCVISVPSYDMYYICIVLKISCLQAFLDKITLSSAHYAY